jgi:hypothetical protein
MIEIQNRIITGNEDEYHLYFNDCKSINAAVSVLIGVIPIYASSIGKKVYFHFREKDSPVFKFMKSVGIYKFFIGSEDLSIKQEELPFGKITDDETMEAYTDKIIELAPIIMNDFSNTP